MKVGILGAGGEDYFSFYNFFREREDVRVEAFFLSDQVPSKLKKFPASLAGDRYPDGIPIYPESDLEKVIEEFGIEVVVFAYSDVPLSKFFELASRTLDSGSAFGILPKRTIKSSRKVIAVVGTRTGVGKSQMTQQIFSYFKEKGVKAGVIRHNMIYREEISSDLIMRFETREDLDKFDLSIEEREEYEPLIDLGAVVYSGIDFKGILREIEKEAEIIIWDGGNNAVPFIKPDLTICIADPLRTGDELNYYPSEINVRLADILIIGKANLATPQELEILKGNLRSVNPSAPILLTESYLVISQKVENKKVLIVADSPSLTHGELKIDAALIASEKFGAEAVTIKPYGFFKELYAKYPDLSRKILPSSGYSSEMIKDLEKTINQTPADLVLSASPCDLSKLMNLNKPVVRVSYRHRFNRKDREKLFSLLEE